MPTLVEIRDSQQKTWNRFSAGWKKWDKFMMNFLSPVGNAIVSKLETMAPARILDIATGTGEPGLTAARRFPQTTVMGMDISEDMLAYAKEKSAAAGIKNFSTRHFDGFKLPEGEKFDAVIARFGLMFFPDMEAGLAEIKKAAKPGAKVVLAVWGMPGDNPWASIAPQVIQKTMNLAPPPPDAVGMFRCAQPGFAAQLFEKAGFKNVTDETVSGRVTYKSPEQYWEILTDVVAPAVAALENASAETVEQVRTNLFQRLDQFKDAEGVTFPWAAKVISAHA